MRALAIDTINNSTEATNKLAESMNVSADDLVNSFECYKASLELIDSNRFNSNDKFLLFISVLGILSPLIIIHNLWWQGFLIIGISAIIAIICLKKLGDWLWTVSFFKNGLGCEFMLHDNRLSRIRKSLKSL